VRTAVGQFVRKSWEQLLPRQFCNLHFRFSRVGLSDQLLLLLLGALSLERGALSCLAI
jgi:hypothetical protein